MSFFSNIFGSLKTKNSVKNLPNENVIHPHQANLYLSSLVCRIKRDIDCGLYDFVYTDDRVMTAKEEDGTAPEYLGHFVWMGKYLHENKGDQFTSLNAKYDCQLDVKNHIQSMWNVRRELFQVDGELPTEIHTSEMVALIYLEFIIDDLSIRLPLNVFEAYATLTYKYNLDRIKAAHTEMFALVGLTDPVLNISKTDTMKFLIDTSIEYYYIDGLKNYENGIESKEHLLTLECLAMLIMKGFGGILNLEAKRKAITLTVRDILDTSEIEENSPIRRLADGYLK